MWLIFAIATVAFAITTMVAWKSCTFGFDKNSINFNQNDFKKIGCKGKTDEQRKCLNQNLLDDKKRRMILSHGNI